MSNGISKVRIVADVGLLSGDSEVLYWDDITDSVVWRYKFDFDPSLYTENSCFAQIKDADGNISGICKIEFDSIAIIGPSGGYIFYDCDADNTEEDPDGPDDLMSSVCGWRYLEAAPSDLMVIDGVPTIDPLLPNYTSSPQYYCIFGFNRTEDNGRNVNINGNHYDYDCSGEEVGTGENNTQLLLNAMGDMTYSAATGSDKTGNYAARLCENLTYSVDDIVYDDWFLPSIDELNLMFTQLRKNEIGCFVNDEYWSSSEIAMWERVESAHTLDFSSGYTHNSNRDSNCRVRPVRAF